MNKRQAATVFAALLAMLVAALSIMACGSDTDDQSIERPDNYRFDREIPAALPSSASHRQEAYADCVMRDEDITNHGYSSHENLHFWLTQRCRFLEPPPLGLTEPAEVQECIHDYGPWLAHRYKIGPFPKGWYGSRGLIVAETICAPSEPFGQRQTTDGTSGEKRR